VRHPEPAAAPPDGPAETEMREARTKQRNGQKMLAAAQGLIQVEHAGQAEAEKDTPHAIWKAAKTSSHRAWGLPTDLELRFGGSIMAGHSGRTRCDGMRIQPVDRSSIGWTPAAGK